MTSILVPPARICETLGLAWSPQLRKLRGAYWSRMVMMTMRGRDGRNREVVMIPLKVMPIWLSHISVKKVEAGLRAKLLAYQLEVVEVLSTRFESSHARICPPEEASQAISELDSIRPQSQKRLFE